MALIACRYLQELENQLVPGGSGVVLSPERVLDPRDFGPAAVH